MVLETLPIVRREISRAEMVAYAGATWDWHRLHYDDQVSMDLGFVAPVVDGQMLGGIVVDQVLNWAGPHAWLIKFAFRCVAPVLAGQVVEFRSNVVDSQTLAERQVLHLTHEAYVDSTPVLANASSALALEPCRCAVTTAIRHK